MSIQTDIASLRFRVANLENNTAGGSSANIYFYISGSETITASSNVYISGSSGIILSSSAANNSITFNNQLNQIFSSSINNQTPNTSTPVAFLAATGSEGTISVSIVPKSSGSFLLSIPDNTVTGGILRGSGSIDLQRFRTQPYQVAAGMTSSILGGANNQISGGSDGAGGTFSVIGGGTENIIKTAYSVILGGQKNLHSNISNGNWGVIVGGLENTSSGRYSFLGGGSNNTTGINDWQVIAGGRSNNCAGQASFIGSGEFNTITASDYTYSSDNFIGAGRDNKINGTAGSPARYSSILGGTRNSIDASDCVIPGGSQANSLKTIGRFAFASGHFGTTAFGSSGLGLGNAQMSILVTRAETTGTTPNHLTTDGTALLQGTLMSPLNYWNSNYVPGYQTVKAYLIGASSDANYAVFEITYVANSTAVLGTPTITTVANSAGASTWSAAVFHPGVYTSATAICVTGSSAKNIRWVATSYTTHLAF